MTEGTGDWLVNLIFYKPFLESTNEPDPQTSEGDIQLNENKEKIVK